MSILLTIIFFSLCFGAGWLLTTWLQLKAGLEKLGASMLLGLWLETLAMMITYQITGSFSQMMTLGLALGLNIVFLLLMGRDRRQDLKTEAVYQVKHARDTVQAYKQSWSTLNRLESLLVVVMVAVLSLTGLSNLTWPVSDWDAIALYDFRAILIERVGNWFDGKKLGYFYQYPPFTSLLHGAVYLMGVQQVKIVYSVLFISFMLVFYAFLRGQTKRMQAIIGVFLLMISPIVSEHMTVAYTNLPYTIYFCVGVLYIWRWFTHQKTSDMILALLFTAAACWVRASEPFWIISFLLILVGRVFWVKNVKWRTVLFFSALFVVLVRYWPEYVNTLKLPLPPAVSNDATMTDAITPLTLISHAVAVTKYLFTNAVMPLIYLFIPAAMVVFFDKTLRFTKFYNIAVASLVLFAGSIVAGTYFFSYTYRTWDEIGPSLTRLMMAVVPLLIYLISVSSFWEVIFRYVTFSPIRASKLKAH